MLSKDSGPMRTIYQDIKRSGRVEVFGEEAPPRDWGKVGELTSFLSE